jgi:hypothetical protein
VQYFINARMNEESRKKIGEFDKNRDKSIDSEGLNG